MGFSFLENVAAAALGAAGGFATGGPVGAVAGAAVGVATLNQTGQFMFSATRPLGTPQPAPAHPPPSTPAAPQPPAPAEAVPASPPPHVTHVQAAHTGQPRGDVSPVVSLPLKMPAVPELDVITDVFVARRPLGSSPLPKGGINAHSALLVKTKSGAHHVVEYSADLRSGAAGLDLERLHVPGEARSYPVTVKTLASDPARKFEEVVLTGPGGDEAVWTKQYFGKETGPDGRKTVDETRDAMQMLMGGAYGPDRKCHEAQEATRKWLGVFDDAK